MMFDLLVFVELTLNHYLSVSALFIGMIAMAYTTELVVKATYSV